MKTKTCPKCKKKKNTGLFSKNRTGADGLCSWCKECMSKAVVAWNKKNRDRKNGYNRAALAKRAAALKPNPDSPEFMAGKESAVAGKQITDCPHSTGRQRRNWLDGYLSERRK